MLGKPAVYATLHPIRGAKPEEALKASVDWRRRYLLTVASDICAAPKAADIFFLFMCRARYSRGFRCCGGGSSILKEGMTLVGKVVLCGTSEL